MQNYETVKNSTDNLAIKITPSSINNRDGVGAMKFKIKLLL